MRIRLRHFYPGIAPARLWELVTDYGALHQVCRPLLHFDGLPENGQLQQEDHIECHVRVFGWLPPQTCSMHVIAADPVKMWFLSQKYGAGVRSWGHHLQVLAQGNGTELHEEIEIDAGVLTPVYALWARILHRHHHKGRLRLLAHAPS